MAFDQILRYLKGNRYRVRGQSFEGCQEDILEAYPSTADGDLRDTSFIETGFRPIFFGSGDESTPDWSFFTPVLGGCFSAPQSDCIGPVIACSDYPEFDTGFRVVTPTIDRSDQPDYYREWSMGEPDIPW